MQPGALLAAPVYETRLLAYDGEDLTPFVQLRRRLAFLSAVHIHQASHETKGVCRGLDVTLATTILEFEVPDVRYRAAFANKEPTISVA